MTTSDTPSKMINKPLRVGNFTSSEVAALMKEGRKAGTFGAPALTYIEEKNMERRLLRSIGTEVGSRSTTWGNLVELAAFSRLSTEYKLRSDETIQHQSIEFWTGTPDLEKFSDDPTLPEIKCPHTLKSFCQLVDPIYNGKTGIEAMNAIRENHKSGEDYYWQIVSNAIITGCTFGELIVYAPYQKDLEKIRQFAERSDKFKWVGYAQDEDLPYLIEGAKYKDLNIITFEIPQDDKDRLTQRVLEAGKMLEPFFAKAYSPTKKQIVSAQEKIKLMNDLKKALGW